MIGDVTTDGCSVKITAVGFCVDPRTSSGSYSLHSTLSRSFCHIRQPLYQLSKKTTFDVWLSGPRPHAVVQILRVDTDTSNLRSWLLICTMTGHVFVLAGNLCATSISKSFNCHRSFFVTRSNTSVAHFSPVSSRNPNIRTFFYYHQLG